MREEAGGLQKGMPSSGQSAGRDSKSGGSSPLLGIKDTEAGRFLGSRRPKSSTQTGLSKMEFVGGLCSSPVITSCGL